jgi:hypothetical protein
MAAIAASIIYVIYGTLLAGRGICMIACPTAHSTSAVFLTLSFLLILTNSWRHHFRNATSGGTDQETQGDGNEEEEGREKEELKTMVSLLFYFLYTNSETLLPMGTICSKEREVIV